MAVQKKLHIVMVTTHPPSAGSLNEYAYYFVRSLHQKAQLSHLSLLVDELPEGEQYPRLENTTFIPCWEFDNWWNSWRIWRTILRLRPDAVLFNLQFASFGRGKIPAALGLFAPLMSRLSKIPTVVLLHNLVETVDLKSAGFSQNRLMQQVLRGIGTVLTKIVLSADLVAVTIPKYVEILEEKYKATNVMLAPHGAFEEFTPPLSNDAASDPSGEITRTQIMTFGKFGTYKRIEILIEAFHQLQEEGRDQLQLVIAGGDNPNSPGYLASMREKYANVPNILFTGYVPESDVARIFQEATVVVFPYTSTTGSSGVLHQAGDYGKAVVLPNIGDFVEVIREEGFVGEYFEPDDSADLARAIANLLDNPEQRIAMQYQNHIAARGIPIDNVVDWYLMHMEAILAKLY